MGRLNYWILKFVTVGAVLGNVAVSAPANDKATPKWVYRKVWCDQHFAWGQMKNQEVMDKEWFVMLWNHKVISMDALNYRILANSKYMHRYFRLSLSRLFNFWMFQEQQWGSGFHGPSDGLIQRSREPSLLLLFGQPLDGNGGPGAGDITTSIVSTFLRSKIRK